MKPPQSTLVHDTLLVVKASAVRPLMPLNAGLVKRAPNDVDVAFVASAFSPSGDLRPRSAINSLDNYGLNRLTSASPIRRLGATS